MFKLLDDEDRVFLATWMVRGLGFSIAVLGSAVILGAAVQLFKLVSG